MSSRKARSGTWRLLWRAYRNIVGSIERAMGLSAAACETTSVAAEAPLTRRSAKSPNAQTFVIRT